MSCNRDNDEVFFSGSVPFRDAPCEYGLTRLAILPWRLPCFCGDEDSSADTSLRLCDSCDPQPSSTKTWYENRLDLSEERRLAVEKDVFKHLYSGTLLNQAAEMHAATSLEQRKKKSGII